MSDRAAIPLVSGHAVTERSREIKAGQAHGPAGTAWRIDRQEQKLTAATDHRPSTLRWPALAHACSSARDEPLSLLLPPVSTCLRACQPTPGHDHLPPGGRHEESDCGSGECQHCRKYHLERATGLLPSVRGSPERHEGVRHAHKDRRDGKHDHQVETRCVPKVTPSASVGLTAEIDDAHALIMFGARRKASKTSWTEVDTVLLSVRSAGLRLAGVVVRSLPDDVTECTADSYRVGASGTGPDDYIAGDESGGYRKRVCRVSR